MKTKIGHKYLIDFHEGDQYMHFHGVAERIEGSENLGGLMAYMFDIGKINPVWFASKDVVKEVR